MNRLPLLAFLLAFSFTVHAKDSTKDSTKAAPYFDPKSVDYKTLLGNSPDEAGTKAEIEQMLPLQTARTEDDVKRIKREVPITPWIFDIELGPWFKKENLPATANLIARIDATEHPIIDASKDFWNRPRPFKQDSRIHPPIDLPKNASYPSGHSTIGNLTGLVLAELVPDLKDKLTAYGQQIGQDRVLAGVHFPSDVAAGHKLAEEIFKRLMATPEFQADLAKAKAEIAVARAKN